MLLYQRLDISPITLQSHARKYCRAVRYWASLHTAQIRIQLTGMAYALWKHKAHPGSLFFGKRGGNCRCKSTSIFWNIQILLQISAISLPSTNSHIHAGKSLHLLFCQFVVAIQHPSMRMGTVDGYAPIVETLVGQNLLYVQGKHTME